MQGSATTERHAVPFLDILGYPAIVSGEDPDGTDGLFAAVSDIVKDAMGSSGTFSEKAGEHCGEERSVIAGSLGCRVSSDDITVSCGLHPCSDDPFMDFGNAVATGTVPMIRSGIRTGLLGEHGLLSGGGTVIGGSSVQDGSLFGKALADAYMPEEAADAPRMLIGRDVKEVLEGSARKAGYDRTGKDSEGICTRDHDGGFSVRHLSADARIGKLLSEDRTAPDFGRMLLEHRDGLLGAIGDDKEDIGKERGIRHEYVRAATYHNEEAVRYDGSGSEKAVGLGELFDRGSRHAEQRLPDEVRAPFRDAFRTDRERDGKPDSGGHRIGGVRTPPGFLSPSWTGGRP